MPNHVINEIRFSGIGPIAIGRILSLATRRGRVDFSKLVPMPNNVWIGNVGKRHEEAFPHNGLDWSRREWGTKWNAYDSAIKVGWASLTLVFQTAWSPPAGWLVALYNKCGSFDHAWMSEGDNKAHRNRFIKPGSRREYYMVEEWSEVEADADTLKRLHVLLWGCESFDEGDT